MKLYISDSDPDTLYHECLNANFDQFLFSTYKIEGDIITCGLHEERKKNKCRFKIPSIIFLASNKNLIEQGKSTIIKIKEFKGQIIEMEDNFGDR